MLGFLKPIFKLLIPYIVKYLVLEAEEKIVEAAKGSDKKSRVIQKVEDFARKTGFIEILDKEKLSRLIDKTVQNVINKI